MTDTSTEAIERLRERIHESKAGKPVRLDAQAALRALAAERDALRTTVQGLRAQTTRLMEFTK